jgi:DNA-binding GntR family transcriptional regulator
VAYDRILDWIHNLVYEPGDALVETELSAKLAISRTPVREALQRLEREHLVEIRKGVGAFVARITLGEIRHIFEVREVIEGMMSRLACRRNIPTDDLVRIRKAFDAANRLKDSGRRLKQLQKVGNEMHDFVRDVGENHRLRSICRSIRQQVRYHQEVTGTIPVFVEESAQEHLAIVEALLAKDGDKAEKTMRFHIRSTLNRILDSYKH